jgi:deoxyribodipyrimidine photo-lyase
MAEATPADAIVHRPEDSIPEVDPRRARVLSHTGLPQTASRGVVYWMSRDQRVNDNWALLYAQSLAMKSGVPFVVAFCLYPDYPDAAYRHFAFMVKGHAPPFGFDFETSTALMTLWLG